MIVLELFALGAALVESAPPPAPPAISTEGPWRLIRLTEPGPTPRRGLEVWLNEPDLAAAQASDERFRRIVTLVHRSDTRVVGKQNGSLLLTEFDCEKGRWREIAHSEIEDGKPLDSAPKPAEWLEFVPHTAPVFVSDFVCEGNSYEKLQRVASHREAFAYERERDRLFEIVKDAHLDGYSVWVRLGAIPHKHGIHGEVPVWFRQEVPGDEAQNSDTATFAWPITVQPKDRSATYHRLQIRCVPGPVPLQYSSHDEFGGLVTELKLEEARRMLSDTRVLGALVATACAGNLPSGNERSTGFERFWPSPSDPIQPAGNRGG